ncbi:MAG: hypothetical protein PHY64_00270 [Eubacteriales bacterium]|nr:hypothetical protein [Eubacteriales bacterium]
MSSLDLDVSGMDDLERYFGEYRSMAESRRVQQAVLAGGRLIENCAREKIHSVSGDLAGSLETKVTIGGARITATVHHGKGGAHDHLVEYGHEASGWNPSSMPVLPHPYLWPAYEEQKNAAYDQIRAGVAEVVRKR